jgi:hypothetical protein
MQRTCPKFAWLGFRAPTPIRRAAANVIASGGNYRNFECDKKKGINSV